MISTWTAVAIGVAGIIGSGAVNLIIIGIYVGKYQVIVEQCMKDSKEARNEAARVGRQVAAFTGVANGTHYREEE